MISAGLDGVGEPFNRQDWFSYEPSHGAEIVSGLFFIINVGKLLLLINLGQ